MSEECCGPDEASRPLKVRRVAPPVSRGDACCAAEPADATWKDDACCDPDPAAKARDEDHASPPWWRDPALLPPVLSGVLLLAGYLLSWAGASLPVLVLQGASLLAGAWVFVPGALRRLLRGRLGVGLLMTIAAGGAVLLGHVGEAATLAFLFSLAETLEDRAMDRAKEGLRALLSLIPDTVRVSKIGGDVTIPAADVRELDLIVVAAGERVATDGVVVEGRSRVDTSAITGESIPVEVGPGDAVAAGSVNGPAVLRIEATADGRDNSLTQIVALVERAHARKGERARLADRIARPLVPLVLIAAVLVAAFGFVIGDPWTWIERALVVLVAASPCALAIAVPVTVISAIGSASTFGIVIKSGEAFERFGTIRAVALDKTGTLTRGEPSVAQVVVSAGFVREEVLALAAAVERTSTHPVAAAITAAAVHPQAASEVVEDAGRGIGGRVSGRTVRVGSERWLDPGEHANAATALAQQGMTVVVVEVEGRIAGLIGVRDELRPEAAATVAMLREQGLEVVMLTGDNARTAAAIGQEAGISDIRAEQLPADKALVLDEITARLPAAMVGDGINDAPALATATVGIAMGAKGSAAAIESADIAFTGHDLRLIPAALRHARRGRRIMAVNIGLALAIIVGLFPLALFGVLGLAGVVLVHEVAEVIVILNGIRAAQRPAVLRALAAAPAPEPATVGSLR